MAIEHGSSARAATLTPRACPATVSVPVRSLADALAATDTSTAPLPLPVAPLTIDIHARSEAAVHAQPAPAVTVTEADPPVASNVRLDAESTNVHGRGVGCTGVVLCSQAAPAARTITIPARAMCLTRSLGFDSERRNRNATGDRRQACKFFEMARRERRSASEIPPAPMKRR